MKIKTLGRHVREGIKNIGRNGWMTLAAIVSVMVTLLVLGVFLLLALNVNHIADNIEQDVEIRATVELEANESDIETLRNQLAAVSGIAQIEFVPSEQGVEEFLASLGEDARYFEELKEDHEFLPDMFVIQTKNPQDTPDIAQQIEQLDSVGKVNYGGETTETLFSVTNTVRNIGIIFIIGLAFTAMLLIANTIKVTINARKTEIEIMKLVGASNSFVRWPFFIEGLVLGVVGALIPALILIFGYDQLLRSVSETIRLPFFQLLPMYPLAFQISFVLIGIGAFIGIWGSIISIHRFLRV